MFRERLTALPPWRSDDEAADFLLRRCLLIHLKEPMDKFNALVEGADAVMVQELQLGGHLYLQVLKERLEALLISVKYNIIKKAQQSKQLNMNLRELQMLLRAAGTLEQRMETFLATGNAPSNHVSLPQYKGLTIVAENINRMRYMSHFKAIHRGSFFMEMRTTEARQLLPDAWGFVCPVTQNPDLKQVEQLPYVLVRCGMAPISAVTRMPITVDEYLYPVFIDGRLVGYFDEDTVQKSTAYLRSLKIKGEEVPISTEIVVIPKQQICGQYPGVFLFTTEARMMRPVINLSTGQLELIGTMEQLQDYAFGTIEIGVHEQPSSVGADARLQSITPHATSYFCRDSKPDLARYFDGEKSQYVVSRFHGKEEVFVDSVRLCGDFNSKAPRKACIMLRIQHATSYFCRDNSKPDLARYFDGEKSQYVVSRFHGKEEVFVDSVRLCGDFNSKAPRKACIMLRIQRNPTVGDKFASRAGQKGICSQKWAAEDLPFTESGLIPDILFNPHGFPSRARRDALPLQRERHGNQLLRPPAGVGWLQLLRHRANSAFTKLTAISPEDRRENGISFLQSGLFLHLLLVTLSTDMDKNDKIDMIRLVVSWLPESSDVLKFRWTSRLVLGHATQASREFQEGAAAALPLRLSWLNGSETSAEITKSLNEMEELSSGVCGVALGTLYMRGRWRAAPTLLNDSLLFRDAEPAPSRYTRLFRINDIVGYAYLHEWDAEAIEISYATPGLTLLMLVPKEPSLRKLVEKVTSVGLESVLAVMHQLRAAVTLPLYTLRMTLFLLSTNETDCNTLKFSHAVQRLMFWAEAGRNAFKDDGEQQPLI
ncbi:hypothetical protein MSG28_000328, partial [Choristoneura fumiferana]